MIYNLQRKTKLQLPGTLKISVPGRKNKNKKEN